MTEPGRGAPASSPHRSVPPDPPFAPGIAALLHRHLDWVDGARVGLVSHNAAVDRQGVPTWRLLHAAAGVRLCALFGPEHGFAGTALAGAAVGDAVHAETGVPLYSLYGRTRVPTPEMLAVVDVLVVDLQDLGARPYTYCATLRGLLEQAAASRKRVVVCDRPIPLAHTPDGPPVEPGHDSFVAAIPAPMLYAMTPGETALWLQQRLGLELDLRVARMQGYRRGQRPQPDWPPWCPPSPRIGTWASACCYAATVACEALPALDYGSGGPDAFQVCASPLFAAAAALRLLDEIPLPGVFFELCSYRAASGLLHGTQLAGLRLTVTDTALFRPVLTSLALLSTAQRLCGILPLWQAPEARPGFFDQLFGGPATRRALLEEVPVARIAASWEPGLAEFRRARAPCLLYPAP